MSCNTKTSLAAVIDAVNAQLNNNYVDRDDPRIDQGVFTEPTIRGGLMLDEAAKLDFCGYVTECGQREPFGKQWVDRPLYPYNTLVSYEDGGEIKSRWQDIDDVVAGTEIGESYTNYEETRSLGLQGYTIIDSFELGATITQRNQALRHAATGKLYRWAGDLSKIVPAGSTPVSSGGVDTNAWLEVSDAALRQEILTGGLLTDTLVVVDGSLTQRTINEGLESIADLSTIENPKDGLRVYVKSYHAGLGKGGGYFTYSSAQKSKNDYGSVVNGWIRTNTSSTVNIYDFGAIGDGLTEDTIAVQKAIDYIASKGGGVVYFPAGDYPIMVSVTTPNIKFQGESINTTTIRAANTATMVRVHTTAPYFKLDNIKLTAQTIFNEAQEIKRFNTKALHCIHLNGYKPTLSNFSTRGGRYDGVYVDYDGEIDATFTNFFMDTSARNPLSVISGSKLTFQNGRIYIDNTCHSNEGESGSADLAGLCIVDFEPDYIGHKYDNIIFDNVLFESNGTSPDNWQIKFEDTNIGDVNDLRLTMRDCEFRNTGGATATPSICLYNRRGGRYFKGVTIDGLRTSGRLMTISDDTLQYIQSSTFNNITLTNVSNLGYGVFFGAGCVLNNIKHIAGTPIYIQKSAGVTLKNFGGYPDINGARCVEDTSTGMLKVEAVRYLSLGGAKEFALNIPQNSSGTLKFRSAQTTANTQNNTIVDVHFFTGNVAVDHVIVDHRKEVTPPLTVSPTAPNDAYLKVKSALDRNLLVSLECFVSNESKAKDIISRFNSATLVSP